MRLLDDWIRAGVHDAGDPGERARLVMANVTCLAGAVISLMYATGYAIAGARYVAPLATNVAAAALYFASHALVARERFGAARHLIMFALHGQILLVSFFVGTAVGYQFWFLGFATLLPLLVLDRPILRVAYPAMSLALYAYVDAASPRGLSGEMPAALVAGLRLGSAIGMAATVAVVIAGLHATAVRAERALKTEHERSERLLLNVLPPSIAERLKGGEKRIADRASDVTVLFADIVGFTPLSARLSPESLVGLLDEVFLRFDDIVERTGLEKIKTIGDAYMAAAGLPDARGDHVEAAIETALAMRDAVDDINRHHGYQIAVRIGVHSGPVVAGVIGARKFAYDLWGDTVNTASRMESHGAAGEVHVTGEVAARIRDRYTVKERGSVEVKGKGAMQTFFVARSV